MKKASLGAFLFWYTRLMRKVSLRSYHNPMIWAVIALTIIALFRGFSELYLSDKLNALINQQNQTQQYTNHLTDLSAQLTNAETGQRGYLITSDAQYLQPYMVALNKIHNDLTYLRTDSISSRYKSQIGKINSLTDAKLTELKTTIVTMQSSGQTAAYGIVATGRGQILMNEVKAQINYVLNQQDNVLKAKQDSTKKFSNLITFISPFGLIVNLALIYSVLYLASRAVRNERRLEGVREQFVTVASHQLRTPATAVKQYIYLLTNGFYGPLSKKQCEALEIINASNERGISVANSLLSVTRADAGEINISDQPVDLNNLVSEVIDHYKVAIKHTKNQEIICKLPKKPVTAHVDPFYMRMVFDNLIDNASKYSPDNKQICVTLKRLRQGIEFSVKDQGIGIKPKDKSKLFRKFARLDNSFKINSEGSGLGLYLVKKLVELHGGTIRVESQLNKGSTFIVCLPGKA